MRSTYAPQMNLRMRTIAGGSSSGGGARIYRERKGENRVRLETPPPPQQQITTTTTAMATAATTFKNYVTVEGKKDALEK